MGILREHIKVVFTLIQPEFVIKEIANDNIFALNFADNIPNRKTYHHYSKGIFSHLTTEQVDVMYDNMREVMRHQSEACNGEDIFCLLPEFTNTVLKMNGNVPVYRQDKALSWRMAYFSLGQDILIASYLAYQTTQGCEPITRYNWPSLIETDDKMLQTLFSEGLAENHFHLHGSTRTFDLSWISCMNHPDEMQNLLDVQRLIRSEKEASRRFHENLNVNTTLGTEDNQHTWKERLLIACWLRVNLMMWMEGYSSKNVFHDFHEFMKKGYFTSYEEINGSVETARNLFGNSGKIMLPNGKRVCLDYAITDAVSRGISRTCCVRSLMGERAFLYHAFDKLYSGQFHSWEDRQHFGSLFYLYLLIKIQFRNELIQVNGRLGFQNFEKYQDRKDELFWRFSEYQFEAKNLSVHESLRYGNIKSLEMRITPKDTADALYQVIFDTDREIDWLMGNAASDDIEKIEASDGGSSHFKDWRRRYAPLSDMDKMKGAGHDFEFFYVIHFVKFADVPKSEDIGFSMVLPRNDAVRKKSKQQALALAGALQKYNYLCSRIRGIDTCNVEIGCRPEVFGPVFRFLKHFKIQYVRAPEIYEPRYLRPKLSATYHAGEDYMDILDGLRAIDEAVMFLELETGDRIGHALALGVQASEYYQLKKCRILIKKQDHLDNIVWALHKCRQYGIEIDSKLRTELRETAHQFIGEIYGYSAGYHNADYYQSMRLRGNDPEDYFLDLEASLAVNQNISILNSLNSQYRRYSAKRLYTNKEAHSNIKAEELFWKYHYDAEARERGGKFHEVEISEAYIRLTEALQIAIQKDLEEKGIGIECNPSSNVCIGSFKRYDKHPIFTLSPIYDAEVKQFVSVNTDDQGIFDTSLKEEFSLLACALRKQTNSNGTRKYHDDDIYEYLERIRRNGFWQAFPKTK